MEYFYLCNFQVEREKLEVLLMISLNWFRIEKDLKIQILNYLVSVYFLYLEKLSFFLRGLFGEQCFCGLIFFDSQLYEYLIFILFFLVKDLFYLRDIRYVMCY